MDKENAGRRASSQSATASSSSIRELATKLAVATKDGSRPKMGRDTAPVLLRLGKGTEDAPLLRFTETRVGGSKTLPLRLRNDTPVTQTVTFERIPREEGFLVDPCRATLPPGAEELVRVSWLPSRASAGPYCGVMHAVLNDGVGGSAAALKVRLRAPPVPQISGATGNDDDVHRRRASTASSVGSHVPARRASVTAYGARRASALQPLSGNHPRRRFRASLDESAPDLASPGFKRSRADCDRLLPSAGGSFDRVPSTAAGACGGGGAIVPSVLSFTASEQSAQRRRKLPKIAAVGKTLRLRGNSGGGPLGLGALDDGHRPDFASFHTEFWVRQQEVAFTHWLNATIVPHTHSASEACADRRARRLASEAARTRLWSLYSVDAEVRSVILRVESHIDDGFLRLRGTEDDGGFKSGGSFLEDVKLRDEFERALGSYSLFWLRAAVDTLLGNPGDVVEDELSSESRGDGNNGGWGDGRNGFGNGKAERNRYATERAERTALVAALVRDRALELEFGVGSTGAPPFADGYQEALAGTVLKRTLLLVFLMDRARSGLPPNTPLLFRGDAPCKSSAAVAELALRASTYGTGDVLRHIGHMGYRLYHAQEPIREYDFTVRNLAVDLRDGVRLCRLVEVLAGAVGDDGCVRDAKFPADSRAARTHNVRLALDAAVAAGVELPGKWKDVSPADVVDGHLANTLGLLYALMMHFQAPRMLPIREMDDEIARWRSRRANQILAGRGAFAFHGATLAPARVEDSNRHGASYSNRRGERTPEEIDEDEAARSAALFADELADAALATSGSDTYSECEVRLLRWARGVCACVGVDVTDFKSSFADGTALCALVHAYAPRLAPLRAISRPPKMLNVPGAPPSWRSVSYGYLLKERRRMEDGDDDADGDVSSEALEARARATAACKANFKLASEVCRALGGVPELTFGPADVASSGGPDAKVVAGYLLFLCARLLCHRREDAAATKIQRWWRFKHWRPGRLRRWCRAATTVSKNKRALDARRAAFARMCAIVRVQSAWRGLLARRIKAKAVAAACTIQRHARGKMARDAYADVQFATLIAQTHARRAIARRAYLTLRHHTIRCQAIHRGALARDAYMEMLWMNEAATTIQSAWRGWRQRAAYVAFKEMVVHIQAMARGATTRRMFLRYLSMWRGATRIQAAFRGYLERRDRAALVAAAVCAQKTRKRAVARRAFLERKKSAVAIQAAARGWIARERYNDVRFTAVLLQARVRGVAKRREFLELRGAAIAAQRRFRAARIANARERAAIKIQAAFRGWSANQSYVDLRFTSIVLQARARGARDRTRFQALKRSVAVAQKHRRRLVAAREDERTRREARESAAREAAAREAAAATAIQAAWRGAAARRSYKRLTSRLRRRRDVAATLIQTNFRCWAARCDFLALRWASSVVRHAWRAKKTRDAFVSLRAAAVRCQAFARGAKARRAFLRQKRLGAATVVQACFRGWSTRRRAKATLGPRVAELAALIKRSRARAAADPSRTLGARAARAVATLHAPRRLREVRDALRDLAVATRWSGACRRNLAGDDKALAALLRTVRRCDRSSSHEPVLAAAYALFENLSADATCARALFECRDSVNVIAEHMQMCRDRPELVAAAVRTVVNLCGDARRAAEVAAMGKILGRIRSIAEIMQNNVDVHRHRRVAYVEQRRPDKAAEEATAAAKLELSIASMKNLISHLEPHVHKNARQAAGSGSKKPPRSALLYPRSRSRLGRVGSPAVSTAVGSPAGKGGAFCDKENATAAAAAAGKGYNAERERRGALERERIHGGVLAAI